MSNNKDDDWEDGVLQDTMDDYWKKKSEEAYDPFYDSLYHKQKQHYEKIRKSKDASKRRIRTQKETTDD